MILASGGGSNARKIAEYFDSSESVSIGLIACNKENAGVWNVAKDFDLETYQINRENFGSEDGLLNKLKSINPDLIVLAGFLWKIPDSITKAFPNKIINIHPALLPKYGGKGMYGTRVHEAVAASGDKHTGITVHYVNENYDEGHVIFQKVIEISSDDGVAGIEKKIHKLEHDNFPFVIDFLLRNDY